MATQFFNFDPLRGFYVATYRQPDGYYHEDVRGLIADALNGRPSSCPVEGSLYALEDGSLWTDDQQEEIDAAHYALQRAQREQSQ